MNLATKLKKRSLLSMICFVSVCVVGMILYFRPKKLLVTRVESCNLTAAYNLDSTSVTLASAVPNRTQIAPKSKECDDLESKSFNLSRAIFSAEILKNTELNLSQLYATDNSMLEVIKNISKILTFYPLPTLKAGSTCIIVGSSGVLLRYPGLGKTIDSYDYVIRINFPPTVSFESFVGSKTSANFAYVNSCLRALKNSRSVNNSYVIFGGSRKDEYDIVKNTIQSTTSNSFKAMLQSNQFTQLSFYSKKWIAQNLWKKGSQRPSTGVIALLLASKWCPTVPDFAGFGMEFESGEVPYHYFDNVTYFKNVHSAVNENYGILKLQRCGLIGRDLTHSVSLVNIAKKPFKKYKISKQKGQKQSKHARNHSAASMHHRVCPQCAKILQIT